MNRKFVIVSIGGIAPIVSHYKSYTRYYIKVTYLLPHRIKPETDFFIVRVYDNCAICFLSDNNIGYYNKILTGFDQIAQHVWNKLHMKKLWIKEKEEE